MVHSKGHDVSEFPCTRCGACCRRAPSLDPTWPKREDGACLFLTEQNECSIYNDRPLICRVDAIVPEGLARAEWHQMNAQFCNKWQEEDGLDTKFRLPVIQ